jgi:cytochrome c oxidase subunit 3
MPGKAEITLLIVLLIETVLFGTFVAAYLLLRADHPAWTAATPLQFRLIFPSVNTLILIACTAWLWQTPAAARRGNRTRLLTIQQATLLLGLLFITVQTVDFSHSGMAINDPGLGGAFFALIAFHAVHVLAGVVFLGLNVMRTSLGDFTPQNHTPIRMAAWFWVYITLVWVVLYVLLYLI